MAKLDFRNFNQTLNKYFLNNPNWPINSCIYFNNSIAQGNGNSIDAPKYFTIKLIFDSNSFINNDLTNDNSIIFINIFSPFSLIDFNNFTNPNNLNLGGIQFSINLNQRNTGCVSYEINEIYTDTNYILHRNQ